MRFRRLLGEEQINAAKAKIDGYRAEIVGGLSFADAAKKYSEDVGSNENAARLSGVRVKRVTTVVYMIAGFCASLAGLIIASQLQASQPSTGESYELNAIAATVLGGTSLFGGKGTIGGAIIGAFVIGVLSDGMVLIGISDFWQTIIRGAVIVLAVIIDQLQERIQARAALQRL